MFLQLIYLTRYMNIAQDFEKKMLYSKCYIIFTIEQNVKIGTGHNEPSHHHPKLKHF